MTARLAASVTGADGAPVVVLGSSLGTTHAMWDPQLPALAERFRVVAFDHRGHGESEVPAGPYEIADLGRDVIALLDRLGVDHFGYAGLSLGGMVGMWVASEIPDRVDRLALLCTSPALDAEAAWRERAAAVRADGMSAVTEVLLGRWFTAAYATAEPETIERFRQMLRATPVEGYAGCCDAIAPMDLRPRLGSITAPTLSVGAALDPSIPPIHAATIADGISDAQLVIVEDSAHLANVQQADVVTALLLDHFGGD